MRAQNEDGHNMFRGTGEVCNLTYLAGLQDPAVIIEETKVGY